MKIGVIGIGEMGRPIAANLLKAGHSVVVYNRTLARAASLEANGALVAQRVSEACQDWFHDVGAIRNTRVPT